MSGFIACGSPKTPRVPLLRLSWLPPSLPSLDALSKCESMTRSDSRVATEMRVHVAHIVAPRKIGMPFAVVVRLKHGRVTLKSTKRLYGLGIGLETLQRACPKPPSVRGGDLDHSASQRSKTQTERCLLCYHRCASSRIRIRQSLNGTASVAASLSPSY